MCDTCGCGHSHVSLQKPGEKEHTHLNDGNHMHHDHHDGHGHDHHHGHEHHHHHHNHENHEPDSKAVTVDLEQDVLSRNQLMAERNRGYFEAKDIAAYNLVSSPGSGKTTLLEKTIAYLKNKTPIYVIEGDQQTMNDADRIHNAGAEAIQVNTGKGCHLDADMVNQAVKKLHVQNGSFLFIENVGNLVCPAMFDLGEQKRVVIISVTEGDDKPAKYPFMFESSDICIINKTDLLPHVDFDLEKMKKLALQTNHHLKFIEMSCKSGEGMEMWWEEII